MSPPVTISQWKRTPGLQEYSLGLQRHPPLTPHRHVKHYQSGYSVRGVRLPTKHNLVSLIKQHSRKVSVGKREPWQQGVVGDRAESWLLGLGLLPTTRQCLRCMGKLSSNTSCPKKSTRNETFSTITSLMEPRFTGKCYFSIIFLNFAIFIQPFLRLPESVFQASNIQVS